MTKGMRGEEIVDVKKVVEQGAVLIGDDGFPPKNIDLLVEVAKEARKCRVPIAPHCEESWLKELQPKGGSGFYDFMHYNNEVKYIRDCIIHGVKDTLCSCHFPHVSLEESIKRIEEARKDGLLVTAEATPHHFTLTWEDACQIGANARVNPPLRTSTDVAAVKKALQSNIIDVIASDHAPHAPEEKSSDNPPFGIIGLETTLGIVLTHLVHPGVLSLYSAIEKMTANPARILKIRRGELSIGMPADITIIDLNREWVVDVKEFESKGRNCPFDGWKLKGRAVMTIIAGKVVMNEGKIFDPPAKDPRLLHQLKLPFER